MSSCCSRTRSFTTTTLYIPRREGERYRDKFFTKNFKPNDRRAPIVRCSSAMRFNSAVRGLGKHFSGKTDSERDRRGCWNDERVRSAREKEGERRTGGHLACEGVVSPSLSRRLIPSFFLSIGIDLRPIVYTRPSAVLPTRCR